jgi:hypothetical protein
MAALPLTGISTSMVAQAIGEASNDVGTLFLSTKVNAWGFNPPGAANLAAVWGKSVAERTKLSPTATGFTPIPNVVPGYHLGYFRGYDHDWVVYMNGGLDIETDEYYDPFIFRLYIEKIPPLINKPDPATPIDHLFKIEFARNENAFNVGTATLISDNFIVTEPYGSFEIEALYPPDYNTNGSLDEGETFYIKVTHLSSPERRWFATSLDEHIFSFTTPESAYTNTFEYRNFEITAIKRTATPAITMFKVEADLYADFRFQQYIDFTGMMSTTSDYSMNVYTLYDNSVSVPPNSTPGTKSFVKHLSFDFSLTTLKNYVSVGSTVYGKIVASTGQQYTGSAVVTDNLPLD